MMLELKNIYKTYAQGKLEVPVLKNISLSVDEGEYVAIMGPSGSGKTTLMNIIGCLDSPTSGEYLLEGEDLAQNSDSKMSDVRLHSIGFVFQSFYLLSRQSALENVALPLLYAGVHRSERIEIARKALERVGLGDRTEFKPTQLSGGQCQRVAIARAIVNNPKILLADEPTGALDTKSGEQIMEIFRKLNEEGVTIVMITHEPEIAAHAQRTLHIRDGRLMDESGHFLSPEEPEPLVDALPEDVIPVKEFRTEPLDSKPRDTQAPRIVLPVEVSLPVGKAASAPDAAAGATAAGTVKTKPAPALTQEEPAPAGTAVADIRTAEAETLRPAEEVPSLPEAPAGGAADSADYSDESFLDAEISALLDAELSPIPEAEPKNRPETELHPAGTEEKILPASQAWTEPAEDDFFDIDAVSEMIDEEEAPEEEPILVPKPVSGDGPEQISFNIWADPEPEIPELPPDAIFEQQAFFDFEAAGFDENQTSFGEEPIGEVSEPAAYGEDESFDTAFDAVEEYAPADLEDTVPLHDVRDDSDVPQRLVDIDLSSAFKVPVRKEAVPEQIYEKAADADSVPPEEVPGEFGAYIPTEMDPSRPFGAPPAGDEPEPSASGNFRTPIKIEIDGLGLGKSTDSPEASADRGNDQ